MTISALDIQVSHLQRALDLAATVGATAADIVRLHFDDNGEIASVELTPIADCADVADTFGRFVLNFAL